MRNNPQQTVHSTGHPGLGGDLALPSEDRPDRLLPGLAVLWLSAILIAPLVEGREIYAFFALICHQIPDRSWFLGPEPLATCIRCTAIYSGFLAGLLLRLPPAAWFLRASIALLALELSVAYLWVDLEFARAISGLLLGLAAAGFVSEGVRDLRSRVSLLRNAGNLSPTHKGKDILDHV